MTIAYRLRAALAKIETVYGTDSEPEAANALALTDVTIVPIAGQAITRGLIRPNMGADPQALVGKHVTMSFAVELAGGGAAGTVPNYGPLLRACGLSETIVEDTSVTYEPVSSAFESASIYFFHSVILHKLAGARGSVAANFEAGQIPRLNFSMTGLFTAPAASTLPAVDPSSYTSGVEVSDTNTPTFTLHSHSGVMDRLSIDLRNQVEYVNRVGSESVQIVNRQAQGSARFEAPALGTKDFFGIAAAGTRAALALTHGTVAGNIVSIACPKVQVGAPTYEDAQGTLMLAAPLNVTPDEGDDEISLVIT